MCINVNHHVAENCSTFYRHKAKTEYLEKKWDHLIFRISSILDYKNSCNNSLVNHLILMLLLVSKLLKIISPTKLLFAFLIHAPMKIISVIVFLLVNKLLGCNFNEKVSPH